MPLLPMDELPVFIGFLFSFDERDCIECVKLRGIQLSASMSNRKITFHFRIPRRLPVHDTFPSKSSASTIDPYLAFQAHLIDEL